MINQRQKLPLIPAEMLSAQQKQIYELISQGLSNKEIATKLELEQRTVATQMSRIRKKAAKLPFTYKTEPGAKHAPDHPNKDNPAGELKKKIRDDPGFFKLMFDRYATDTQSQNEDKYQLASAGQDSTLLLKTRAKHIKTMAAFGKGSDHAKVAIKMEKKDRQILGEYFQKRKIKPVQFYWDDGSAIYLVTLRDINIIQQLLNHRTDD